MVANKCSSKKNLVYHFCYLKRSLAFHTFEISFSNFHPAAVIQCEANFLGKKFDSLLQFKN